jgi:hypothetical protein
VTIGAIEASARQCGPDHARGREDEQARAGEDVVFAAAVGLGKALNERAREPGAVVRRSRKNAA